MIDRLANVTFLPTAVLDVSRNNLLHPLFAAGCTACVLPSLD